VPTVSTGPSKEATEREPRLLDAVRESLEDGSAEAVAPLLQDVPSADIAAVLEELSEEEQGALFRHLDPETRAEVLGELGDDAVQTLAEAAPHRLQDAVGRMEPDEAVDVLALLPPAQADALLGQIPQEQAAAAERLLKYRSDSAGGLMTPEFVVLFVGITAREAIEITQRSREAETVGHLFVADEADRLVGYLPLQRLVFASPDRTLRDLMEECPFAASPEADQEELVRAATHYRLEAIPVVDAAEKMIGVVTVDDILEAAEQETDEDMYKLAGTGERDPMHASVYDSTRLRLPWLMLSVLDGLFIAFLMSRFEGALRGVVELSFFIPLIPLMGGQVAIQGSTIMVRALALGNIRHTRLARFLGRQLVVALLLAVCCSLLAGVLGVVLVGTSVRLMVAVGLAVAVAIIFAGMLGMIFPLAFNAVGIDPAVSSGPFITMLSDLFCICTYLALGMLLAPPG